MIQILNLVGLY